MELMQKYAKENDKIGVYDIKLWPLDSYATGFLSSITSEVSVEELRMVSLIARYALYFGIILHRIESTVHKGSLDKRPPHWPGGLCLMFIIYIMFIFKVM